MRPFFFSFQFTPYVILFIERDGSTYLSSLLSSHPDIEAVYERFAVLRQKGADALDQIEWAKAFWTPTLINRVNARGFKTKLIDIEDHKSFRNLLIEKKVKIIHMHRENRVKAVVSKINAKRLYDQSGYWNLYKETDRMPPIEIDPILFQELLVEREGLENELKQFITSLDLPVLQVTYEELMIDREKVLAEIFKFLGVRQKPVKSKTLKHTSDDLREIVLNFDDLRSHYQGTQFAAMFDEVLTV